MPQEYAGSRQLVNQEGGAELNDAEGPSVAGPHALQRSGWITSYVGSRAPSLPSVL